VRAATGTKIGTIQRLMISKRSGKVAYVVLKFGGLLGFGEKHFPVPWRSLKYSPTWEAYESEITEEELRRAPSFAPGEEFDWGDRSDQVLARTYRTHSGWY
jgi:PRC-barrel domain